MSEQISYIDGLGRITVSNGLVYAELVAVLPPAAEGAQPVIQPAHRVVMQLPQFIQMCAELTAHVQRMEQQGLIRAPAPPS